MIGILGGTFDPVHNGHLHIAREALRRLRLDHVQFMPCALPVHRGTPGASARQRCEMLELALADEPRMVLNRLEIDRGGPSYTVDSLREIARHSGARLVLLMGGDAFNGFDSWKAPDEILRLANIAVCHRPGVGVDADLFADNRVISADELEASRAGAILVLEVDAPDCSSSSVRGTLAQGQLPRRCLHPGVAAFIEKHQLYRSI